MHTLLSNLQTPLPHTYSLAWSAMVVLHVFPFRVLWSNETEFGLVRLKFSCAKPRGAKSRSYDTPLSLSFSNFYMLTHKR